MPEATRILVTAVSGDLAQSIVKALRVSAPDWVVYGCDRDGDGAGRFFVDRFALVPGATDHGYLDALDQLATRLDVDAVVPGSEPELSVLGRLDGLRLPGGVPVVAHPSDLQERLGDKLSCMRWLDGVVPIAPFADGNDDVAVRWVIEGSGFPLVVKERRSSGSRGFALVHDEAALTRVLATTSAPLVQAFLPELEGEYSVGTFTRSGRVDAISFRRRLRGHGPSMTAETSEDEDVIAYAQAVAHFVGADGALNVQVRKSSGAVRLLEVNPRLSSLAAARAAAGFHDTRWWIDRALGRSQTAPTTKPRPLGFRRYYGEVVDTGDGFRPLQAWQPRAEELRPPS